MTAHGYYCETLRLGTGSLSKEESHHAASVLRVRAGEGVELFDGCGSRANATITGVTRGCVTVEVTSVWPATARPQPELDLYVAVPKGARQHVLIEKCTELGVTRLQPIVTARSVVKPDASAPVRWKRYAVEAAKQSRQDWLPRIEPPLTFASSLESGHSAALRVIASLGPGAIPLTAALRAAGRLTHAAAWIGPEGGFTPDEMRAAVRAGLQTVSLTPTILRVETAALVVAAAVRLAQPDRPLAF